MTPGEALIASQETGHLDLPLCRRHPELRWLYLQQSLQKAQARRPRASSPCMSLGKGDDVSGSILLCRLGKEKPQGQPDPSANLWSV